MVLLDDTARYVETHLTNLLELLTGSDVSELELQADGLRVRLHRAPSSKSSDDLDSEVEPEVERGPEEVCTEITSPLVGVFYRSLEPGAPPFVGEGSIVEEGTVVGIIEALEDIPTEVEADCAGEITQSLVGDGQPVEYGQPLFEIRSHG
jgi:biotin carboxyl carrier protein